MLLQSNATVTALVTTRAGHASDAFSVGTPDSIDPYVYDGVVAIGGDGLLFEIMQGVNSRPDADGLLSQLPFGIIPGGSGNGLAASVCKARGEADGATQNCYAICKNAPKPADLSTYTTKSGKEYTSFLSLSWGIVADVDLESDRFRALGSMRFDVYAVWRMISLRKYRARLMYLPPDAPSSASSEPGGEGWKVIEDTFQCFWALQTTHAAINMYTSPGSSMHDGLFHINVVRGSDRSRYQLLTSFLAFEDGSHVEQEHVEIIKCRAYKLVPLTDNTHVDLDGEEVEYGEIEARMREGAWRVYY